MRTLAIGDIHGCHTALATLLKTIQVQQDDTIIFLGDYIDRGPKSKEVVDTLIELPKSCSPIFVRGNHEVMMLKAREDATEVDFWKMNGGWETLRSYGAKLQAGWPSQIPPSHWDFFERTINYFEDAKNIFVHGCVDPDLDMKDQQEFVLLWERFELMLMFPHKSGKRVVCGHTPQPFGIINAVPHAVCIDTGPAGGGWLSCLDAHSGEFWQANEQGETRMGVV